MIQKLISYWSVFLLKKSSWRGGLYQYSFTSVLVLKTLQCKWRRKESENMCCESVHLLSLPLGMAEYRSVLDRSHTYVFLLVIPPAALFCSHQHKHKLIIDWECVDYRLLVICNCIPQLWHMMWFPWPLTPEAVDVFLRSWATRGEVAMSPLELEEGSLRDASHSSFFSPSTLLAWERLV